MLLLLLLIMIMMMMMMMAILTFVVGGKWGKGGARSPARLQGVIIQYSNNKHSTVGGVTVVV